jgi:peptide/nickel transport system substrate-binding protein
MKRAFATAVAAALLSVAAAAPAAAQTLRVVMHSDLKTLDPLVSTQYIVRNHAYLVWDQLLAMDAKGQVRPQMAEKWDVSADGLTYTFRLRDGLEWHDGASRRSSASSGATRPA